MNDKMTMEWDGKRKEWTTRKTKDFELIRSLLDEPVDERWGNERIREENVKDWLWMKRRNHPNQINVNERLVGT